MPFFVGNFKLYQLWVTLVKFRTPNEEQPWITIKSGIKYTWSKTCNKQPPPWTDNVLYGQYMWHQGSFFINNLYWYNPVNNEYNCHHGDTFKYFSHCLYRKNRQELYHITMKSTYIESLLKS